MKVFTCLHESRNKQVTEKIKENGIKDTDKATGAFRGKAKEQWMHEIVEKNRSSTFCFKTR